MSANKLARDSNPFSLAVDFVQTPSPYIKGKPQPFRSVDSGRILRQEAGHMQLNQLRK